MIAPTPMLNVNAETVDFIDLDADSVAVAGVAADLGASETFLRVYPQPTTFHKQTCWGRPLADISRIRVLSTKKPPQLAKSVEDSNMLSTHTVRQQF